MVLVLDQRSVQQGVQIGQQMKRCCRGYQVTRSLHLLAQKNDLLRCWQPVAMATDWLLGANLRQVVKGSQVDPGGTGVRGHTTGSLESTVYPEVFTPPAPV